MAYLDTYTPITVANSKSFNDGADFNRPELMGGSVISMAPGGRSLSDMLKGFDEPGPAPITPGTFVRAIEAEANAWGNQFAQTVQQAQQAAASYWAAPPVPAAKTAPSGYERAAQVADGLANTIGSFADGLAGSLTGASKPAMPEVGVEMASLRGSFGQLSQSEPSAFERRYQQPGVPRKPGGSDYV